jgi:hypothetical protein
MALELGEGDFWDFRWEWTDQSCSQSSGCSAGEESGLFRVMLGIPRVIGGVEMFAVEVTGQHIVAESGDDLAPEWAYLGTDGSLLIGSNGSGLVTLFDARTGQWTGAGFFSRFGSAEDHAASPRTIDVAYEFAEWEGVRTGPAIAVVRSDEQTNCEIIEGRRICPNDESFSLSETQFYREGVGPLGYTYRYSASFSGGGFFSSSASVETVALVASSLRGDEPGAGVALAATPAPEIVFGPVYGALALSSTSNEIPDFAAGVDIEAGVVDVTFTNPDVGSIDWSYGITFRHSSEEEFHIVYVRGNGDWEHFVRGGSVDLQVTSGRGAVALDSSPGGQNRITVEFGRDTGALYVNDRFVATLDLSTSYASQSGDVRLVSGVTSADVFDGSVIQFTDFAVWER